VVFILGAFLCKAVLSLHGFGHNESGAYKFAVRVTVRASLMYTFRCNQQDATLYNILYYCQCSTCFGRSLRPSSGAQ
jgi:hypothetical protein